MKYEKNPWKFVYIFTLFEIFIFCPKIQLWFPEKIVDTFRIVWFWGNCDIFWGFFTFEHETNWAHCAELIGFFSRIFSVAHASLPPSVWDDIVEKKRERNAKHLWEVNHPVGCLEFRNKHEFPFWKITQIYNIPLKGHLDAFGLLL